MSSWLRSGRRLSRIPQYALGPPTVSFGFWYRPIRGSSCHSKMTMLTRGSLSPTKSSFINLVRINGSTDPPQDFRLYIPEHRCRSSSPCFCVPVSAAVAYGPRGHTSCTSLPAATAAKYAIAPNVGTHAFILVFSPACEKGRGRCNEADRAPAKPAPAEVRTEIV